MVMWLVVGVVALVALVVGVWVSHRFLVAGHRDGSASTSMGDGFGGLADVFAPGQARARQDIQAHEHQSYATPTSGDDPHDKRIRLEAGQVVRIKRPTPPTARP